MECEWDPAKNAANIAMHGIDFATAVRIFDGSLYIKLDDRYDYGELRLVAYGKIESTVLVVVYTMRGEVYRIISARRANRRERRTYHQIYPEESP